MTTTSSTDRIEKTVNLRAGIDRVWRALTDHEEFGEWFRVKIDGPFIVGSASTGRFTFDGRIIFPSPGILMLLKLKQIMRKSRRHW